MKKLSRWMKAAMLVALPIFLAGCGATSNVDANSSGVWDGYIIYPLSQFIIWLSNLLGGSYGLGIILFTIIILVALTPLTKMQMDSQFQMAEIQPEIEELKKQFPNRDRASMEALQQAQQDLMKERGVNQFAGCLPLLIQLPVMFALYQVIARTEVLRDGHFLWLALGKADPYFILPILAAVLTWYSSYLTVKANPIQNGASKAMTYVAPAMILLVSFNFPAAVTLYWVVSNAVRVVQTFIFYNPYKIIAQREAKRQEEKARQRRLRKALKKVK